MAGPTPPLGGMWRGNSHGGENKENFPEEALWDLPELAAFSEIGRRPLPPLHTYPKGQNPKHQQHQMLMRMWNRRPHSLLVGKQNGTDTLEDGWAVSYTTKRNLTV